MLGLLGREVHMHRSDLHSDCGDCAAVCCIATSFEASPDFANTKSAGEPCHHLDGTRCAIHHQLTLRGFKGCAVYDCYGAGPRVTREFTGPERARNEAFMQLRVLHELLWFVLGALELCPLNHPELRAELVHLTSELSAPITQLSELNIPELHARTHTVLRRVGAALGGRTALPILR